VQREITDYETFTARTQAIQSVDIKARVSGYLTKIAFQDGADVKNGETLFVIDQRPYKAALDEANASLAVAKATLVEKQAEYDIGLAVQKENPKAISQQELVRRQGERDEAAANVETAQAQIESAQLNYDWCTVTSPIDGRISRHLVDIGNVVSADVTLLANVVSLKPIWAYFQVDENTVIRVKTLLQKGQMQSYRDSKLNVQMALGNNPDFSYTGAIDFTGNQLDPNTGSIEVRATFPNEQGFLIAGMFCRVRVPIGEPHQALLVDNRAVGTNQSQRFVLVVNDQDVVEYREVDVGQVHDDLIEVLAYRSVVTTAPDGTDKTEQVQVLKPTDRLIVSGLQRVRPGVKVNPQLVDMTTFLLQSTTGNPAAPPTETKAESKAAAPQPAATEKKDQAPAPEKAASPGTQ
jgi:RND family efflux transporter MFP subunit